MREAAVPKYMSNKDKTMSPGHRFGPFFRVWEPPTWIRKEGAKAEALNEILDLKPDARNLLEAVQNRQAHAASRFKDQGLLFAVTAESSGPFVSGMGMDHPLENGFAFLNPYGLPYLPGAGVKGILRRAAEDLALGGQGKLQDWTILDVWLLFGFEAGSAYLGGGGKGQNIPHVKERAEQAQRRYGQWLASAELQPVLPQLQHLVNQAYDNAEDRKKHLAQPKDFLHALANDKNLRERLHHRGALVFWDVFPRPFKDRLHVEILTPHFIEYYQGNTSPADCDQPRPNPFLTIPPRSTFQFYVQFSPTLAIREIYGERWQSLVKTAFAHAFDWLGFGAKTSVGYGQMRSVDVVEPPVTGSPGPGKVSPEPPETAREVWPTASLSWSPGDSTLTAAYQGKKATAKVSGAKKEFVPAAYHARLFKKKKSVSAKVTVEPVGNAYRIVKVEQTD